MAMRSTEAAGNVTDRAEPDWREPGLIKSAFGEGHVPGTGGPWRWFFTAVWLVYLIGPVAALFGHGHGVAWIAGGLAITIAFCAIYLSQRPSHPPPDCSHGSECESRAPAIRTAPYRRVHA